MVRRAFQLRDSLIWEESMRIPSSDNSPEGKKPGPPKGLRGLLLYGALTILGGLALIVVTE
jgi:hypothetical protein